MKVCVDIVLCLLKCEWVNKKLEFFVTETSKQNKTVKVLEEKAE